MAEGMSADGPNLALAERLIDGLYGFYRAWLATHQGEVSQATAIYGVMHAAAKICVDIYGQASPDGERLMSWEDYQEACVAALEQILSEAHAAEGAMAVGSEGDCRALQVWLSEETWETLQGLMALYECDTAELVKRLVEREAARRRGLVRR